MATKQTLDIDYTKYNFRDPDTSYEVKFPKGLSREIVERISEIKNEPDWMRQFRLRSYEHFMKRPLPTWGGDLSTLNFDDMLYYASSTEKKSRSWEEVPSYIKETFDKLGIPEAERKFLGGVGAQYESEVVYHSLREDLAKKGIIFLDTDTALREYPDLFKKYFGTVVPPEDNKFAALNSAVWSGGSFIYVPEGVTVDVPLQAYFRINTQNMGQFERTLIIADKNSRVHYIEGCLPVGEQISTGKEWTDIESVRPGDVVLNSDGEEARVRAIRKRPFQGDLITVRPLSKGNTFQLTPEHPVLVVPRSEVLTRRRPRGQWLREVNPKLLRKAEPHFLEARDLRRGDFLVFPIPRAVRDNSDYTVPVLRLLGYYLAEGSTFVHQTLHMPVVEFSFGFRDRMHAQEVKRLINAVTGKRSYEILDQKHHGITVLVYSKKLRELCLESCGKGARTKELSKTIMELPPRKQAHLLETYLLGDGSRYQRAHEMIRASTASAKLAHQLQELIARQGHYATISVRKGGPDLIHGRRIARKDQYVIYYSPDKRQSEVRRRRNVFLVPIKALRRDPYAGPVFNIELDHAPNAYLTRGFAVHNCTAPIYSTDSLHSAVVEIIAKPGAHVRYTTIQNWSNDVYNLVTKRAYAYANATVEWVDGNLGSKLTMKYPSIYLVGSGAKGEILSIAFAGKGQHQDAGGKVVHLAPYTTSRITSKSVSKDGGRTTYRGLLHVAKGAKGAKSSVRCDALLLDEYSRTDTYPYNEINEDDATTTHEATVGKIGEDQLFYLMSRGLSEQEALSMIVMGFMEPFTKELPMEYAIELNRLIQLEMAGSVG
jgi:Fe-S cluster assembly protein SufB